MAVSAFMNHYRAEYVPAFQRGETPLRAACTTEANVKGNTAIFLVSGTPTATATTRGTDGLIVARSNANTQNTCTLEEINDLVEGTEFTWDLSQGDQRRIAIEDSSNVIYRKVDQQIIDQLDTATINDAVGTASLDKVATARGVLSQANCAVEEADNMFGLVTPAFMKFLMQLPEFSSADYVDIKPFSGVTKKYLRWMGVNWVEHSGLTGAGTATEKCYMFHRKALGHAIAKNISPDSGFDRKQKIYWANCTAWANAKLLQNSGVVQMLHDGSSLNLS